MIAKHFLPELPHPNSLESPSDLRGPHRLGSRSDSKATQVDDVGNIRYPGQLACVASSVLPSSRGTRELKFVVEPEVADRIEAWADRNLMADPHAGEQGGTYRVNNLYLDTPNFDTFFRRSGFQRRKFRLRRYGCESTLWLELKRKHNGLVRKRRVSVAAADWFQLLLQHGESADQGAYFRQRIYQRQLGPVCQVTYCRTARIGLSATGPIRLTIDRDLFAANASDWHIPSCSFSGERLLNSHRIVEFKFRETLPAPFRGLIQELRLAPRSFSKYRESVAACISLSRLTGESE